MTIAHIENLELGLSVRTKLNNLIDQSNAVGNGGISQLTGDVAAGPGSGSQAATLASVITAGGPAGSSMTVPVIGWDAKGRLTAVSSVAIAFPSPGITQLTGDVTAGPGSGSQATTLASILTAGGPIGSSTTTPVISWDAKGRLTSVGSATISGGGGGGASIGGAVTGGTSGSVLFIDASTNLAQDNTNFFWDATSHRLMVGSTGAVGAYYLNGVPMFYEVPNASGNNWFDGNAGNFSVTGYQNYGTGDFSLASLTTGSQNTCIGNSAGRALTDGSGNFVFGTNALRYSQSDASNTAIGVRCLETLGWSGLGGGGNTGNFAAGFAAFCNATQGFNNVAIGYTALANAAAIANQNVVIGGGAAENMGVGGGNVYSNTMIGCNVGRNLTGGSNANTWIGGFQGPSAVVDHTIAIGTGTGTRELLDLGLTAANTWSFSATQLGQTPIGLHVYNAQYPSPIGAPPADFERAVFDWNIMSNVLVIGTRAGGTGVKRLTAIDGFAKAGAPAAGDLPSGSFAVIDDTSANQTWLVFNKAGTIRKVQLT